MNLEKDFLDGKKIALEKLSKAKNENKADEKILPILDIINRSDDYYTSSSCAGRIVLLEIPGIGDKKNAKFLGKWHRIIQPEEILSSMKNAKTGQLWLLAQSPILHIAAKTSVAADRMVKTAVASGFKHSGLKSIVGKIVVEICSTERLDSPIGMNGVLFCDDEYLQLLVDIANDVINKSTKKLYRFKNKIKENF